MNDGQQDKHAVRRGPTLMNTRPWAQRSRIRCCLLLNVNTAEGDIIRDFASNIYLVNRKLERNEKLQN